MSDLGGQLNRQRKQTKAATDPAPPPDLPVEKRKPGRPPKPANAPKPQQVSAYLDPEAWEDLQVAAVRSAASGATIIAALVERFRHMSKDDRASVLREAEDITIARRG